MSLLSSVLVLLMVASGSSAWERDPRLAYRTDWPIRLELEGRSPAHGSRLLLQEESTNSGPGSWPLALAGMVGSWVGGIAAYRAAEVMSDERKVDGDTSYSPAANKAFIVGSALGGALAIHGAGQLREKQGSFWAAGLGSGLPAMVLIIAEDNAYLPYFGVALIAPVQGMLGSAMYSRTEK